MDMSNSPLVSIITAFYNAAGYLGELLESICNQTYKNIEMICVDDGSTDDGDKLVREYKDDFRKQGMRLVYVRQNNAGQASATNRALKMITGKYLCWIDGDDFLYETAIEKKMRFLESNPDYGLVASDFYLWDQKRNKKSKKGGIYKSLNWQTNQFELTIAGESIIENLAYMLNVELYRKINPSMEIEEIRAGQNYQIILPMMYFYKRGYIDEPLGCYRIHDDSHCHRERTYGEQIERYDELIGMLENLLNNLGIDNKTKDFLVCESTFAKEKRRYLDHA